MKNLFIMSSLIISLSTCITGQIFARCGGDAFAGSLGGSLLGSAIGTSMASRSSGSGSDDGRAIRAVDRLEEIMRRDLQTLNDKISRLERKLEKLEGLERKVNKLVDRQENSQTTAAKMDGNNVASKKKRAQNLE